MDNRVNSVNLVPNNQQSEVKFVKNYLLLKNI